jgi:hypothetical protein
VSTKEQIKARLASNFARTEVDLGEGVKVAVRELSKPSMKAVDDAIDARRRQLFKVGADGKLIVEGGKYIYRDDVDPADSDLHTVEIFLAASMEPQYTVEELLAPDWPDSLKARLFKEAQAINGMTIQGAVGNS